MRKRQKRRNSDENIRKLERLAFTTQDKADIERYWRACLRASIEPKATLTLPFARIWTLEPVEYLGKYITDTWATLPPRIYVGSSGYLELIVGGNLQGAVSVAEGIKRLLGLGTLPGLGTKHNPDEDIRKLERLARSKHYEDVIRYWTACLRAGIVPAPTAIFSREDEFGKPQVPWEEWSIRFRPKGIANFWASRTQLADGLYVIRAHDPLVFAEYERVKGYYDVFTTMSREESDAILKTHLASMIDPTEVASMVEYMRQKDQERLAEEEYLKNTYGEEYFKRFDD